MKKETYLKLKRQKRKAKLLGILTAISLFGCTLKEMNNDEIKANDEYYEPFFKEGEHIEIVDNNGVLYPTKTNNFQTVNLKAFSKIYIPLYDSYKDEKNVITYIDEYQTFNITHYNESYSYINSDEGLTGYVDNSALTILSDNYIEVDLSSQKDKVIDNSFMQM